MRPANDKDKLLETLMEVPFINRACAKIGLHRSVFYRWYDKDKSFRAKVDEALRMGRENVCELGESALVNKMKEGNLGAIKFYLQNNDPRYTSKRSVYVLPPKKAHDPNERCETCGSGGKLSDEAAAEIDKAFKTFFDSVKDEEEDDNL